MKLRIVSKRQNRQRCPFCARQLSYQSDQIAYCHAQRFAFVGSIFKLFRLGVRVRVGERDYTAFCGVGRRAYRRRNRRRVDFVRQFGKRTYTRLKEAGRKYAAHNI